MEAIHLTNTDVSHKVNIDYDLCIGCGVCASNCPQEALLLEKVRNDVPVKNLKEYYKKLEKCD
jgi:Pyruvate/2-oxoacid:ferredoxin oxidoreductase delta subunit